MIRMIFIMVLFTLVVSCTSNSDFNKGKRQLELQGYTNIEKTGHAFMCCGQDDTYATGFKATDSGGQVVKGCFCSAAFKGVTVRFR